jgi:acetyl-CoA carboxylase biotin carboxylase subunit
MKRALKEFVIEGVKTTIPFHLKVLNHRDFQKGGYSTKFIEENLLSLSEVVGK